MSGVKKEDVWETLLRIRWSDDILKASSACLDELQAAEVIFETGNELHIKYDWNIRVNEEDTEFGKELYSIVLLCPSHLVEAAKLSVFYENLLLGMSSWYKLDGHWKLYFNLKTVVAATFHNIQPGAGDNIKDFTAINMWYERLDTRYNFSLGPVVLPLLKTDNLTQLAKLDPPFLKDYKASIDEHQHDNISTAFGKILV